MIDQYLLTLAEQTFMDTIHPSLNVAPYAIASSSNLGATGMIRDDLFKEAVSMSHQGRTFHDSTNQKHRDNNTGKKLSLETRSKMSLNNAEVRVEVEDSSNNLIVSFNTKSKACFELNISMRTLTRWLEQPNKLRRLKDGRKVYTRLVK